MENNNSRIKLRLCQMDIKPNDPDFNALFLVDNLTQAKADGIDLVCAPEMCLSGFDWQQNVELSDQIQNALLTICNTVKSSGVGFCGSYYRKKSNNAATNTAVLWLPTGEGVEEYWYDKIHLFSLMDEPRHLRAGNELITAESRWGTLGLTICYDLRFPEFFHALALRGAKLILLPAAWPAKRKHHWRTLLQARAIENQCYLVAVNQAGVEGKWGATGRNQFAGHSMVIDPFGDIIAEMDDVPGICDCEINLSKVVESRKAIHTVYDRRPDVYRI